MSSKRLARTTSAIETPKETPKEAPAEAQKEVTEETWPGKSAAHFFQDLNL